MGDVNVSRPASEPLQPWQLFTLAGLVGATVVVLVSSGQSPAGVVLLSLIVFAAAGVGVAALRTFLPLTGSPAVDRPQVLGGRTRAALERDKALVLRAIKELEFDRAMGKISERDFAEMSGRLRSRAARILRQLDAGAGYRQQIDSEIERRIGRPPADAAPPAGAQLRPASAVDVASAPPAAACAGCGVANDPDAKFCKNCGSKLGAAS